MLSRRNLFALGSVRASHQNRAAGIDATAPEGGCRLPFAAMILKPAPSETRARSRTGYQAVSPDGAPVVPREGHDDGVEVGALEVEKVDAPNGRVKITITQAIDDAIGRNATWRFHEGGVFDYPIIDQRLVKVCGAVPHLVRRT